MNNAGGEHASWWEAVAASVLSASPDAVLTLDATGHITSWNRGAERIFGYTPEEAHGATLDLLMPPRFHGRHRTHVEGFLQGPSSSRLMGERTKPVVALRKGGEEFPAEASILRFEVSGEVVVAVTLRDVSSQQRHEWEQRLLADVGAALASLDFDEPIETVVRLATTSFAESAALLLHVRDDTFHVTAWQLSSSVSAALLHGLPDGMVHLPPQHPAHRAVQTRAPVLHTVTAEDYARLRSYDPALAPLPERLVAVIAVPLIARDQCLGALLLSSSRRYDEHDLRLAGELGRRCALFIANARLHQSERHAIMARDEALGVVAHDLRNPLNALVLSAKVLQRALRRGNGTPESAETIEEMLAHAERMQRLINDLLDVRRMEAGTLPMHPAPCRADELIREALDAQRRLVGARKLVSEVGDGIGHVLADRHRVQQVLANLIGNAVKFTRDDGRIVVGAQRDGDSVRFSVVDDGPGIAPDDLPRVFDRFWQADHRDHRGVGLGLSIVSHLVEAHGGRVWAESQPGAGSTFSFTLPAAPCA